LVDTLNSAEALTVFAPTNDAFAAAAEADPVNGMARVVCGDIHTDNATIYIIDEVLHP
jgi:uncharacterized surface protein with fasciclin (FAS1) repeats